MRLGVNVDHVATLREARKELFPDPVAVAREAIAGGADGIVCHLREDRRHIKEEDVFSLRKLKTRLDLEMAATDEMVRFALRVKPDMVCLVPERRQEVTTEGGLDVSSKLKTHPDSIGTKLMYIIKKLQGAGVVVSLFIDPEAEQIEAAAGSGAEFIEIHTGKYARSSYIIGKTLTVSKELRKIKEAVKLAKSLGLRINAGHGLDYNNVRKIAETAGIEELNIGFSIIARSVFVGMRRAVTEMKETMKLIRPSPKFVV